MFLYETRTIFWFFGISKIMRFVLFKLLNNRFHVTFFSFEYIEKITERSLYLAWHLYAGDGQRTNANNEFKMSLKKKIKLRNN